MRTISSVLTFEEQKEEENRSRINLIEANGKSGNEGKLSELFILNFWHLTFISISSKVRVFSRR